MTVPGSLSGKGEVGKKADSFASTPKAQHSLLHSFSFSFPQNSLSSKFSEIPWVSTPVVAPCFFADYKSLTSLTTLEGSVLECACPDAKLLNGEFLSEMSEPLLSDPNSHPSFWRERKWVFAWEKSYSLLVGPSRDLWSWTSVQLRELQVCVPLVATVWQASRLPSSGDMVLCRREPRNRDKPVATNHQRNLPFRPVKRFPASWITLTPATKFHKLFTWPLDQIW